VALIRDPLGLVAREDVMTFNILVAKYVVGVLNV
jgi:hypothetical protein